MKDEEAHKLKNTLSGVLVVDKPVGMTSHDVVAKIRKGTGIRRIGHTGTLDPRASGVLVVLIGPAVRLSEYLLCEEKGYEAVIRFGAVSDTYDGDGNVTFTGSDVPDDEETIMEAMKGFVGDLIQVPPAYSAIKIKGRKAYDMARNGETFELPGRPVKIYSFDFIEYNKPELTAVVHCSAGTYIRSLAHDLGQKLGCGAYLHGLRRVKSGSFSLRDAVRLEELKKAFEDNSWFRYMIPASEVLTGYEDIELTPEIEDDVRHGRRFPAGPGQHEKAKVVTDQGDLLAILDYVPETGEWKPKKVFSQ